MNRGDLLIDCTGNTGNFESIMPTWPECGCVTPHGNLVFIDGYKAPKSKKIDLTGEPPYVVAKYKEYKHLVKQIGYLAKVSGKIVDIRKWRQA